MAPRPERRGIVGAGAAIIVLLLLVPSLLIISAPAAPGNSAESHPVTPGSDTTSLEGTSGESGPGPAALDTSPANTEVGTPGASGWSGARDASPAGSMGTPPHPEAISAGGPPGFSGHYYAGAVYSGAPQNAGQVGVTLRVPDDRPEGGNASFYYVILSVWDNAGSYDQLGFANSYGTWGVAYSSTNYCATTYYYSPDAFALQSGRLYDFEMSVAAGAVQFSISNATSGAVVWSQVADTGGTEFLVQSTYGCDSGVYYDYTDYEEVYGTAGPDIPYDLFFVNNTVGPSPEASWIDMGHPARAVLLQGTNVTLENEPYYLASSDGRDSLAAPTRAAGGTVDWNVSVIALNSDGPVSLGTYQFPHGWAVDILPGSGTAPFHAEAAITFPALSPAGSYWIGINSTDHPGVGAYSRLALRVNIGPEYTVTYEQLGLPVGLPWAIALDGIVRSSETSALQIRVPNGTYNQSVAPIPGYRWSPVGHEPRVTVGGSNVTEPLYIFSVVPQLVFFEETGLPTGFRWWVNVTGGTPQSSVRGSLELSIPNGTYAYTVSAACFLATPARGTLTVTGRTHPENVSFTNGTAPCVAVLARTVDGGNGYYGTTLNFTVPGRWPSYELIAWGFSVDGPPPSSYPTPILPAGMYIGTSLGFAGVAVGAAAPGTHRVVLPFDGFQSFSDVVVYALFNDAGFTYRFANVSDSDTLSLPAGADLYLGAQATPSDSTAITHSSLTTVDAQSPTYTTGVTNLVGRQSSPEFSMSINASVFGTAAVGLYPGTRHPVTFQESGLRPGSPWAVTVDGVTRSATADSLTFSLYNGSHAYLLLGPKGARVVGRGGELQPTGRITVSGSALLESVEFRYASTRVLRFVETGLIRGTTWCVSLGPSACSSISAIAFGNLTPWTYAYSVLNVPGYTAVVKVGRATEPTTGQSNVTHGSTTVRVVFTPISYGVSFTEVSAPPGGSAWRVRATCLDSAWSDLGCAGWSRSHRAAATNITLMLRNGTYAWQISPLPGYELIFNGTTVWSGYFTVDGAPIVEDIGFLRAGAPPGSPP
ncbi:MAG TPA: hypothetical protein VML94_02905 [Thermoplasmata archaeon]|nr:hypothetical protein [Thermoplasmata archaeon]